MTAEVVFAVSRQAGSLVVPRDALVERQGRSGAFVVEGGRASFRSVETGLAAGGEVQVLEGLSSGDRVVVLGQANLQDGRAVDASPQEP